MLKNKWFRIVAIIIIAGIAYFQQQQNNSYEITNDYEKALFTAIEQQKSDVQVAGKGVVFKLLPDDNIGSRHQKFLMEVNGKSLLIAHNIDLAPRIDDLQEGDTIEFFGEFEWNNKGGVVHWTHHDPRNKHPHGFLKHNGNVYQ